ERVGHHHVPATRDEMERNGRDGGHTGGSRERRVGSLEIGDLELETAHGWIAVSGVDVMRYLSAVEPIDLIRRSKRECGVLIDRCTDCASRRIRRLAGVHRACPEPS